MKTTLKIAGFTLFAVITLLTIQACEDRIEKSKNYNELSENERILVKQYDLAGDSGMVEPVFWTKLKTAIASGELQVHQTDGFNLTGKDEAAADIQEENIADHINMVSLTSLDTAGNEQIETLYLTFYLKDTIGMKALGSVALADAEKIIAPESLNDQLAQYPATITMVKAKDVEKEIVSKEVAEELLELEKEGKILTIELTDEALSALVAPADSNMQDAEAKIAPAEQE